jgi:hypothetical protein
MGCARREENLIPSALARSSPNIHKVNGKSITLYDIQNTCSENIMRTVWKCVWLAALLLPGGRAASAQASPADLAGEWRLEFRFEGNSADPASRPAPWLTFTATVVQVDSGVGGAMRSDGPSGQFGCKRRGDDVCSAGRMRLSWDEQDWQVFEFRLTPGAPEKGTGRAEIRFPNGATDKYSFTMTRVRR